MITLPSVSRRTFLKVAGAAAAVETTLLYSSPVSDIFTYHNPFVTAHPRIKGLYPLIIKSGSAESHYAISQLGRIKNGAYYLRLILQEGTFAQYFHAIESFVMSNLGETDVTIQRMIGSREGWERSIGMLIQKQRKEHAGSFSGFPLRVYQTLFFRHPVIYSDLAKVLRPNSVVWDAGCSIGLSTESLRMALRPDIRVIGTDISPYALNYSRRAKYLLTAPVLIGTYKTDFESDQTHLDHFFHYAREQKWDPGNVLSSFFSLKEGSLGKLFISSRDESKISFNYDDITLEKSVILDNSVDAVVYTNVHRYLGRRGDLAVHKIHKKLKSGGSVYFGGLEDFIPSFEAVFGKGRLLSKNRKTGFCYYVFVKK
ncbi:MAG: hypothetical protein HQ564_00340 [Candidatus Saganbacteria bacterium]|nr:hypothetical protein [Candidatus Saganbacteria bacterium]